MSVIEFAGVSHAYGDRQVLEKFDLTLREDRIGIIGSNGSGKSTLARMINGLVLPSTGTVTVDGLDVAKKGGAVRRKVGFVFTDPDNQIVMPTVGEDLAFSLRRSKMSKSDVAQRVDDILERFRLTGHADHPAHLLSGGQKQLLAIGAVLIRDPDVVVADEPTTLLDLRNSRMVSEVLGEIDRQVIVVTHHLSLLREFDRVIVVHEGRIAFDGAPSDAIPNYEELLT